MNLLVFGKDGQVARALAAACPTSVQLEFLARCDADLTDPARCAALIACTKADAIINAAAYTAVGAAESQPALAATVNGAAPGAMATAAAARGLPFLHLSTDYVFDGAGSHAWTPDHPVGPKTIYEQTKYNGERAVAEAFSGAITPYVILRTSWVISGFGQNFVKAILRKGAADGRVTVVSDQICGPTPAASLADAILNIAQRMLAGPALCGVYHFSGAPDVSWAALARAVIEVADLDVDVVETTTDAWPDDARRPLNSRLDCSATQADFGLQRPDWRRALPGIVAACRAEPTQPAQPIIPA